MEKRKERGFLTPTEPDVHGDALCLIVMGPFLRQRLAVGGWRLAAVAGWRQLAVGGWWSLGAVLKGFHEPKKKISVLKDNPG